MLIRRDLPATKQAERRRGRKRRSKVQLDASTASQIFSVFGITHDVDYQLESSSFLQLACYVGSTYLQYFWYRAAVL
ncbi:hypothetical protein EYC84_002992 [Monilinia fructicola]|uniref:Uncharacterized protein n=1 Tax=Monilinia fructicola TaxID=38448 RepID=A0A5M9JUT5_MONFR|nr:hypothetical protein EYC84_002992 [Monilinia fructicola]